MIGWLRALSPSLRYLMYVAGALLVLFVAVGVGVTAAVVVGWQFGRVATDSAETSTLVLISDQKNIGVTSYNHNIGVWYEGGAERWAIFN